LKLSARNASGCETTLPPANLVVKPYPVPNLASLSPFICPEQASYSYRLPGPSKYAFEASNGQIRSSTDTSADVNWNLDASNWQLRVMETTANGCVSLPKTLPMQLDQKLDFCDISQYLPFIPNVITPNTDGKNDVWQIGNLNYYPQNSLSIFDRWGKKVFAASPYRNNWGADAKPGIYFYQLNDGRTGKVWKGWVEVLK
jgi:gliding motility-associated-like protein